MAAPTQEYPPWLSPSAVTVTGADGAVFTSTTVVYLPLTYVGPSIPLNTLWTYGGSTYPPSIIVPSSAASSTVAPPPPTTTSTTPSATPPSTTGSDTTSSTTSIPTTATSSSSSPSTTATSTSSTSSSSTTGPTTSSTSSTTSSTTIPTSTPSTSPPVSTTLPPVTTGSPSPTTSSTTAPFPTSTDGTEPGSAVGALSRGQLVGVIVASILGLIFLFVFLLALWLWCKGRRNRRSAHFTTITPLDDDYFIVGEDGRTPGEGSPRHSGEEADPFLQRSGTSGMLETATEMGTRPGVSRVPPPPTGSLSSSGSSSTNTSGYGVLLERPTLGILPPMAEEGENPFTGYRLSEDEMRELNRESVLPQEEQADYTGAYAINKDPELAPPRLVDPDNAFAHPDIPRPQLPHISNPRFSAQSVVSAADVENAALLTARRVNVNDLPPAGSRDHSPSTTRTGLLDAIGLGGLASIGRLFNSGDSQRNSGRYSPTFSPEPKRHSRRTSPGFSPLPLSENEAEAGRALPQRNTPDIDSFGRVRAGALTVGTGFDGTRPVSNISGRSGTSASGATIWHDARTSPGTPAFPAHSVPSRAITPALTEPTFPEHAWIAGAAVPPPLHSPPAYSDDPFVDTDPAMDVRVPPVAPTTAGPTLDDILDQPAPNALTHFTSSSSMRDSGTVSSIGLSKNPFPPGLDYEPKKHVWTPEGSLSAASAGSSPAWHQVSHGQGYDLDAHGSLGVVDILEEEPPNAQGTWRSMASGGGAAASGLGELGRRTTFGLPRYTHPSFIASEQGSLHSMRSHIDPPSIRSTGSAPASVSIHSGRSAGSSMHSGSLSSTSSSRPSVHSASGSIAHSLVRSGSIITDGRRRFDPRIQIPTGTPPPQLPPLSAFGNRGFITPPRSALSSQLSVDRGGALLGEAIFRDGEMTTVDGGERQSVHFSPGAPTIRTVNSGSTCTAVPQGARARTISAVTFGSVIPGGTMGAPMENGEEGDLGLLNEVNAGGRLGSAWIPSSVV